MNANSDDIKRSESNLSKDVGDLFDLATPIVEKISGSLYLNFGYWKDDTNKISAAQENMVAQFGEFCQFTKKMHVLDAGFGNGLQDIFWMRKYGPKRIMGINVSANQVKFASENATRSGLADKLIFRTGDASHLPQDLTGFDRIVGLESAHLFPDIDSFFRTSHDALGKNGAVCLANLTYLNNDAFSVELLNGLGDELNVDLARSDLRPFIEQMPDSERQHATLMDAWVKIADNNGLAAGRTSDITSHVLPFYEPFMSRIRTLLNECREPMVQNVLVVIAASIYMRMLQFKNGSLGYYFLEFIKKK